MLESLFTLGQAVSALLLMYGGMLAMRTVIFPQHNAPKLDPALEDELLLLKHIHMDA